MNPISNTVTIQIVQSWKVDKIATEYWYWSYIWMKMDHSWKFMIIWWVITQSKEFARIGNKKVNKPVPADVSLVLTSKFKQGWNTLRPHYSMKNENYSISVDIEKY